MNCSIDKPCKECESGRLMARMAAAMKELREDREILLAAAKAVVEAEPAKLPGAIAILRHKINFAERK